MKDPVVILRYDSLQLILNYNRIMNIHIFITTMLQLWDKWTNYILFCCLISNYLIWGLAVSLLYPTITTLQCHCIVQGPKQSLHLQLQQWIIINKIIILSVLILYRLQTRLLLVGCPGYVCNCLSVTPVELQTKVRESFTVMVKSAYKHSHIQDTIKTQF